MNYLSGCNIKERPEPWTGIILEQHQSRLLNDFDCDNDFDLDKLL